MPRMMKQLMEVLWLGVVGLGIIGGFCFPLIGLLLGRAGTSSGTPQLWSMVWLGGALVLAEILRRRLGWTVSPLSAPIPTPVILKNLSQLLAAQELVNKYGTLLECKKEVAASEVDLPAPRHQIKEALVMLARHSMESGASPDSIIALRVGYASLADFVSPDDAMLANEFDTLVKDAAGEVNEAKRLELAAKFADSGGAVDAMRHATVEFTRLMSEFDARVFK